jgi:hypothetical protein
MKTRNLFYCSVSVIVLVSLLLAQGAGIPARSAQTDGPVTSVGPPLSKAWSLPGDETDTTTISQSAVTSSNTTDPSGDVGELNWLKPHPAVRDMTIVGNTATVLVPTRLIGDPASFYWWAGVDEPSTGYTLLDWAPDGDAVLWTSGSSSSTPDPVDGSLQPHEDITFASVSQADPSHIQFDWEFKGNIPLGQPDVVYDFLLNDNDWLVYLYPTVRGWEWEVDARNASFDWSSTSYEDIVSASVNEVGGGQLQFEMTTASSIPETPFSRSGEPWFGWKLDVDNDSSTGQQPYGDDMNVVVRYDWGLFPLGWEGVVRKWNGAYYEDFLPVPFARAGSTVSATVYISDLGLSPTFGWAAGTYVIVGGSVERFAWNGDRAPDSGWVEMSLTPDPGTIQGRVVDASTESGIEGALVQAGTYTTTTGTDGHYSLTVNPGTYQIIARKTGYYPNSSGASVASGGTVSVNFELSSATGKRFGVWIEKPSLRSNDGQVQAILSEIAARGGGIVYLPAYDPDVSENETIKGRFIFRRDEDKLWAGTVANTAIDFDDSRYNYSLSALITHAHSLDLEVYASIPCFVVPTGENTEESVINSDPEAPANRSRLWPHLKEVAQYLLQYDVDGIALDFVRYPNDGNSDPARKYTIRDFVYYMVEELGGTELSVTTFSPSSNTAEVLGQDLSFLADADPTAISPMLYASYNYNDLDLVAIALQAEVSRRLIGSNVQYIPILQAYDSDYQDHLCQPGGERLLAAMEAILPANNFAVFAYPHISSPESLCSGADEWSQFRPFNPQPGNASVIGTATGTVVSGSQESLQFQNNAISNLILTFRWGGGEIAGDKSELGGMIPLTADVLQVQIYEPGGALYGTFDLADPVEVITIPGAEPGTWECRVTTTSTASQRYTIVAGAVTYQIYLPIALKNR